ncbi:MAG: DnaD domain protein [Dehalococcoidia bacterium]|nr:DnaD domain protein [Dehalococcoidia bacterium]
MDTKSFSGFPARADYSAIPTLLLTEVMAEIKDIAELKVTLYVAQSIYHKKGYPRFVTFGELASDQVLLKGLEDGTRAPAEALRQAVDRAVARGTLLKATTETQEFLVINDEAGRRALPHLTGGKVTVSSRSAAAETPAAKPNIFSLYEQNIGLLTPIIAEELRAAEAEYPQQWIEDAFKEAVALNKRSWRYIARILENWAVQGRPSGKPGRHPKKRTRPEDYYKGRFGHLVSR